MEQKLGIVDENCVESESTNYRRDKQTNQVLIKLACVITFWEGRLKKYKSNTKQYKNIIF